MYLDQKDSLFLSLQGVHDPCLTMFFQKYITRGQVILDIGAMIGYYTLIFASQVGEEGQVFAFDPDPVNFELLIKNIQLNRYKNVTLVNCAVSNSTGKVPLFISHDNKGDHSLYDSQENREHIQVQSIRLDEYFKDFRREINLIKLDIQGAEYHAVEGMKSILYNNPRVVLVTEFEPKGLSKSGIEPRAYLGLISDLGFKIQYIDEENRTILKTNIQQLEQKCTHNKRYVNLICSRIRSFDCDIRKPIE